jgi:RNA polymerase-binding transcription factor DksA
MAKKTKVPAKKKESPGGAKPSVAKGPAKREKVPVRQVPKPAPKVVLSHAERKALVAKLLALREDLTGQIASLKNDALRRNDEVNPVEDGTDAYDRQFGLSLASSEQEAVAQINDALRRVEEGIYGVCEQCQGGIEKARIEALPFVKTCIRCQSELEKNNSRFRPSFGEEEQEQWEEGRTSSPEGEEEEV